MDINELEKSTRFAVAKPSWDEYFFEIAGVVSSRSSCERSKVGAVIVDREHRVVSVGYNDAPAGMPGCESCPRRLSGCEPGSSYDTGSSSCVALHAEQNAILYANRQDLHGSSLYITREPCDGCMKMISGTGIDEIIWPEGWTWKTTKGWGQSDSPYWNGV